ncbi:hypothetical protein ACHAXR_004144 [Thalassiosira sp. AJA248-18]
MQQDLKTMKVSIYTTVAVVSSSCKRFMADVLYYDIFADPTSSFLSHEGSLSVALMASRRTAGRKRKTTFLSGKQKSSFSRSHSSSSSKSVSLNHVVFMAGDNSQSASQLDSAGSNSNSFLGTVKPRGPSQARKSSKSVSRGSSLWSKVCSKNFRAN